LFRLLGWLHHALSTVRWLLRLRLQALLLEGFLLLLLRVMLLRWLRALGIVRRLLRRLSVRLRLLLQALLL
jgi:hypothetical protein